MCSAGFYAIGGVGESRLSEAFADRKIVKNRTFAFFSIQMTKFASATGNSHDRFTRGRDIAEILNYEGGAKGGRRRYFWRRVAGSVGGRSVRRFREA